MQTFEYEYTDTFAGDANYCWVKRGKVSVPDLTAYGYDGLHGYPKANARQTRQVMRKAKAALGLNGIRGKRETWGDTEIFRPYGAATILFVRYCD
jgi:hypothetical protein